MICLSKHPCIVKRHRVLFITYRVLEKRHCVLVISVKEALPPAPAIDDIRAVKIAYLIAAIFALTFQNWF